MLTSTLRAGEVVALAGENGAGKSTLMKILGGVYQPDEGQVHIDGNPAVIGSVRDATANGVGFVHQELNVLDNLTVAENVFLGREPRRARFLIDRKKLRSETRRYISRLGLEVEPDTPLGGLSIAQQQMVEIAKALSMDARIVIMDEPTSSLTLTETGQLLSVIADLRAEGVSIIYISHRLGEIKQIADRVVVLRDGKNAGTLERPDIHHDNIVKLMVGRDIEKFYSHSASGGSSAFAEIKGLRTRRYPRYADIVRRSKGRDTRDCRAGRCGAFGGRTGDLRCRRG